MRIIHTIFMGRPTLQQVDVLAEMVYLWAKAQGIKVHVVVTASKGRTTPEYDVLRNLLQALAQNDTREKR